MLFLAKRHARSALLVMLGLLVVSNLWAGLRGIALSDSIALDPGTVIAIALGVTLSASIDSVIFFAGWIAGFRPFLRSFKTGYSHLFANVSIPAIFAGGLLAALGEETFFRGILMRELGLLPAALLFALAHAGRGLTLFTVWALLEGLVFGWLYQLTGNLLVPMIVHGIHDCAGMFFGRFLYGRLIPPAATLADWLRALSRTPGLAEPAVIDAIAEKVAPIDATPSETPPLEAISAAPFVIVESAIQHPAPAANEQLHE